MCNIASMWNYFGLFEPCYSIAILCATLNQKLCKYILVLRCVQIGRLQTGRTTPASTPASTPHTPSTPLDALKGLMPSAKRAQHTDDNVRELTQFCGQLQGQVDKGAAGAGIKVQCRMGIQVYGKGEYFCCWEEGLLNVPELRYWCRAGGISGTDVSV